jgi:hypothetical protein
MSELIGVDLTANDASPLFTPGTVYRDQGGKAYKYLQFDNGAGNVAAAAGNFAYYYAPSGASAGATTVATSDLSDSAGVGAGVFQAVLTDQYYGWFQIKGSATLTTALTAGADGNALTPVGSTDGTLDVSALVTDHICAIAVDASARIVLLTCPE